MEFKERNTPVNGTYYVSSLHKFRESIHAKRRGKLTKSVRLWHPNASIHTAAISQAA